MHMEAGCLMDLMLMEAVQILAQAPLNAFMQTHDHDVLNMTVSGVSRWPARFVCAILLPGYAD